MNPPAPRGGARRTCPGQMQTLLETPRSLPVPRGIWRVIFNFLGTAVRMATGRFLNRALAGL